MHSEFVQVHVQAGDLGTLDLEGHLLGNSGHLNSVTLNESAFQSRLSVALGDLDSLNGVFVFTGGADLSNPVHGIDDEFTEQAAFTIQKVVRLFNYSYPLRSNKLGGHGGLSSVDEGFSADNIDFYGQIFLERT